ncbi:MAG: hypothetical protein QXU64_02105 [Thermofilaceae archaeon]
MIDAFRIARDVCRVLEDRDKRALCASLISRVLIYGEAVKNEVAEEARRAFTEEERRLVARRIAELLELIEGGGGD